jgi:hypothetical protein
MKHLLLILLAAILLMAVGVQFYPQQEAQVVEREGELADFLPRVVPGWRSEDRPIAETELVQDAVDEILNYDDALLRFYEQGQRHFSVYVAYWTPGKMSHRLIAGHTPDVCWVGAGWVCEYRDFSHFRSLRGQPLAEAQYRIFETRGNVQHVLYWHISGGELISYRTGTTPPVTAILRDIWQKGLNQRQEQYFIRVSSNVPFDEIWHDQGFEEVMAALLPLGLAAAEAEEEGPPAYAASR